MRSERTIPHELQMKVDSELEKDERIQWIDMPIPHYFTPNSTGAFLFAIPWTAFAVFWMFGAWNQAKDWSFSLFGVPFILIGIGMLSAPFWAYRKSLKTVYVVTSQRAITFHGGWSTTIRSYPPAKLGDLYRKEKKDGTGDVVISRRAWRDSDGDSQTEELGFLRIERPKEVERMLNQLAKQADPIQPSNAS